MKGKFAFPLLSILGLLFIAVLCMPSHVQAAAADQDSVTIAADGFEILSTPTSTAGPSVYADLLQQAFEAGWEAEKVGATGSFADAETRMAAQATLASLVNADGYTTADEVAWDETNTRKARHYAVGDTIKIRVKFTLGVVIHQDVKLRIDLHEPVYMDIDTTVHTQTVERPTGAGVGNGRFAGTVYRQGLNNSNQVSTAVADQKTDDVYVTFAYTVQEGDFTSEGIRMIKWVDPFYRDLDAAGSPGHGTHEANERLTQFTKLTNTPTEKARAIIPLKNSWGNFRQLVHNSILVVGGTGSGDAWEGAFVIPADVTTTRDDYASTEAFPFAYLGQLLAHRRLRQGGTNVYLHSVDTFRADTIVAQIVEGIGARFAPLNEGDPTIIDEIVEQTEAFDIEIKFANHYEDIYAEQPASNTFGAAEILLSGDDVERADWTITDAAFYGLDAVDPGSYDSTNSAITRAHDAFAGEIKASASYAVYRATITPPDDFDGDVRISIAEGAITDLAGNTSKASSTLTVPVNTITDVTIPDETLLAKIKEKLGITAGTVVPQADMLRLTSLDLSGLDVSDLTGLEFATNLEELDLSDTQVKDISALSTLTSLLELSLSGTPVSDISDLSGLTNLKVLDLSDTEVSDISALSSTN